MTDLATDTSTETPSTVIDTDAGPSASGGGAPNLTDPRSNADDAKPASLRDDIEAAFKEDADKAKGEEAQKPEAAKEEKPAAEKADKADAKAEEQSKDDAAKDKAETPADDKPAPDKEGAKAEAEAKSEEKPDGVKFHEPPKRFLPDSREVWRNVPRAVRRDIDTMVQEHETERARFQEVSDRYDRIRDFDDLAKSNGRDLRDSLTRVHHIENLIQRNPVAGVNAILMEVGPRKADGQPVSLYDLAQFVVSKGPAGYQQMVAQPQQAQQPQEDPRVSELQQQLAEMQQQQLAATVIEPFKVKHPRYDELQEDIAFFLQSGKISQSLSPMERLGAAYDMAARINPASRQSEPSNDSEPAPEDDRRADPDLSGSKSIKSSPGSVTEQVDDQAKGDESIRESLLKEMKRLNRA